jgi:hypothetical protein
LPNDLDFCRVVPGSRDAAPEITGASLMTLRPW